MSEIIDGQNYWLGQDDTRQPNLLSGTQFASGINVRTRDGALEPRRGNVYMPLALDEDPEGLVIFESGNLQGAAVCEHTSGWRVVVVVSGHVFVLFYDGHNGGWAGFRATSEENRLDQYAPKAWIQSGGDWVIIQDAASVPLVLDDQAVVQNHSVPVGSAMAFGSGMFFISDPTGSSVYASSIWTTLQDRQNLLTFTEQPQGLVPSGIGKITGLKFLPQLDTGTGLGPLIATGQKGVWAWDVSLPRDQWAFSLFGRLIAAETAVVSDDSIIAHGNEVWWRTLDGIETLGIVRADYGSLPDMDFSLPVREWLRLDTPEYLRFASGCYHDRMMRFTLRPEANECEDLDGNPARSWRHRGIVVLDLQHRLTTDTQVIAWQGIDTGVLPRVLLHTLVGAVAVCQDYDNKNRIYVLDKDPDGDRYPWGTFPVQWQVDTRAFDFSEPFRLKQLKGQLLLDIDRIHGDVDIEVFYRPDGAGRWYPWSSRSLYARLAANGADAESLAAPSRMQMAFDFPRDRNVDAFSGRLTTTFTSLQLRFRVRGRCRIRNLRMTAGTVNSPTAVDFAAYGDHLDAFAEDALYAVNSVADFLQPTPSATLLDASGNYLGMNLTEV